MLSVAMLGAAAFVSGCAERAEPLVAPEAGSPSPADSRVDALAGAFAVAMAAPEVRASVRDAMRASPLTAHKLSLQQFGASPEGEQLLRAAASAVGKELDELRATIAALPELDFYIPARQHRLTWRATGDYVVAVNLNGRGATAGYGPDGRSIAFDLFQPDPPKQAVLMLQTAETKNRRIHPQIARPGATIQDLEDGEIGGSLVFTDASGATRTIELADVAISEVEMQQCLDCGGGGGGGPTPETFLTYIQTDGIVDNNNPFETNEFEFSATAPGGTTGFLRITGIPSTTTPGQVRHAHLIYAVPLSSQPPINIVVKETDGWPNPDDHFNFAADFYCGPVPLGASFNSSLWPLSEDTCNPDPSLVKLAVKFGW
jgi:hypothetical protein